VISRTIRHVDAFTSTPLEGNPAAVVDGEGLSGEVMQRIALNQRLSETVFLLPPESDGHHARLRIFTPRTELPFAGHPTIAASHILASENLVRLSEGEALMLETGAGIIPVEITPVMTIERDAITRPGLLYTMTQASPEFRPSETSLDDIAPAIGLRRDDVLRAERVSTGLFWLIAQVASLDAMMRVVPDMTLLAKIRHGVSIFCVGAGARDADLHVRSFAPDAGVPEDPVTGSSNGCIAAFIAKHRLLPERDGAVRYVAEQGIEMGQPGRVYLQVTDSGETFSVRVGGQAVTVLRGELTLPGG